MRILLAHWPGISAELGEVESVNEGNISQPPGREHDENWLQEEEDMNKEFEAHESLNLEQ